MSCLDLALEREKWKAVQFLVKHKAKLIQTRTTAALNAVTEGAVMLVDPLVRANATVFAPHRPDATALACEVALRQRKDPHHAFGWWGPFA